MTIKRIHSGGAFEPKVGYCRAVVAGDWVHVSGTVASLEDNGEPPVGAKALADAGCGFEHVVRVAYILPDRHEFEACWPALKAAFGDNPPAATMTECGLIDPKYRIEIEVTAYIGA